MTTGLQLCPEARTRSDGCQEWGREAVDSSYITGEVLTVLGGETTAA